MPYLTSTSFDRLLERITIGNDARDTASTRRDAIAILLKDSLTILDIFATGSMVRGTGLKGVSDVDVMVVLHYGKHVEGKSPRELLDSIRNVLSAYNASIVKKNGQAVTLYFKTWPNVDIVPARRVTAGSSYVLQIPDANTGQWITADPASHDHAMAAISERRRQLVRMVKCWNAAHSAYMQSFHIEQIVLQGNAAGSAAAGGEDDWPWALKAFFDDAVRLTEPTTDISRAYGLEDWMALRNRLSRAKEVAHDAWYASYKVDHQAAIERCRLLFGDKFPSYG